MVARRCFFFSREPHSRQLISSESLGKPHAGQDPYAFICVRDSSFSRAKVVADMLNHADNSGMSSTYAWAASRRNATRRAMGVSSFVAPPRVGALRPCRALSLFITHYRARSRLRHERAAQCGFSAQEAFTSAWSGAVVSTPLSYFYNIDWDSDGNAE